MDKTVTILGGGESGVGAAVLGKQNNYEVFVSDAGVILPEYKKTLIEEDVSFEENSHSKKLILNASIVVKSPGIPDSNLLVKELIDKDVLVVSEIEFASWYTDAKLIGITGSNGKTTTTSLTCLLYTSPSPRDLSTSRMPSSA